MNDTIIRLPEETVYYLQRLDYEIAGLQVLHTHALKSGTPLEKRMEIKREFQEAFAEYQMAKDEMWAEYAPQFPNMARWWVDFQTGELHVETGNPQSRLTPCQPPFQGGQRAAQRQAPLEKGGVAAGDGGFQGPGNEVVPHA